MSAHGPVLPLWNCGGCVSPWPCAPRRAELRAEFDAAPVSPSIHMRSYLAWAAADPVWVPAGRLYRRFIGWVE